MASQGGPVIISRSSAVDTFYCDMNTRFIKLRYVDMGETIQNYFEKTSITDGDKEENKCCL